MSLNIAPGKTNVGWIGTGVMGHSMVGHLMKAGFKATVYNRSKDKAQPGVEVGRVTHSARGHTVGKLLAMAHVQVAHSFPGSRLLVEPDRLRHPGLARTVGAGRASRGRTANCTRRRGLRRT